MALFLGKKYPRSIGPIVVMVDFLLLTDRLHGSFHRCRGFGSSWSEGLGVHF